MDNAFSQGLTTEHARNKLDQLGPNRLPQPRPRLWAKFARHSFFGFSFVVWAAVILCFVEYGTESGRPDHLALGIILVATILANSLLVVYKDRQMLDAMKPLETKCGKIEATVLRSGVWKSINAEELVPGDVVEIRSGQRVPADVRVLSCDELKIDSHLLTGENEPVSCLEEHTVHGGSSSEVGLTLLYGSDCVQGRGTAVVTKTGKNTVLACLPHWRQPRSPFMQEVHRLSLWMFFACLAVGALFFGLGFRTFDSVTSNLLLAASIMTAIAPFSLPSVLKTCLARSAILLSQRNLYVKNLRKLETLARVSVVCWESKGVLTQNRMQVVHCYHDDCTFSCLPNYDSMSCSPFDARDSFRTLQRDAVLCNFAEFKSSEDINSGKPLEEREMTGDVYECAILRFFEAISPTSQHRHRHSMLDRLPFTGRHKLQMTAHALDGNPRTRLLVMKGAPERVVDRCTNILFRGQEIPLTDAWKARILQALNSLDTQGERVFAFAHLYLSPQLEIPLSGDGETDWQFPMSGLTFVGLISLVDPPRLEAKQAVEECKRRGVKSVMVTSDHVFHAMTISRRTGLFTGDTIHDIADRLRVTVTQALTDGHMADSVVVSGHELLESDDEKWSEILKHKEMVFGRMTSQNKVDLVKRLQAQGEVVALIGNGPEDLASLRRADVSVSVMGGCEPTRACADVVLMGDLNPLLCAMEQGRVVSESIKTGILISLHSTLALTIPFIMAFIGQMPPPLSSTILLIFKVLTSFLPVFIAGSHNVSANNQQIKTEKGCVHPKMVFSLLWVGFLEFCGVITTYFVVLNSHGFSLDSLPGTMTRWDGWDLNAACETQAAIFMCLIVLQWPAFFISISLQNGGKLMRYQGPITWLIFSTVAMLVLVYIPVCGIGLCQVQGVHWVPCIVCAACMLLCHVALKKFS